jgi:hypothetical protein
MVTEDIPATRQAANATFKNFFNIPNSPLLLIEDCVIVCKTTTNQKKQLKKDAVQRIKTIPADRSTAIRRI